ncbi:STAS domain-containing protein [Actinoallomurus sp. NPDC052308]|uniref:STAS domain-containing protein n=1 Tax=Actinoallomurus sp. NPDC052308 TaxID=3155530 RepID=UPI003413AD7E
MVLLIRSARRPAIALLWHPNYEVRFRYQLTWFCPPGMLEACGSEGGPNERTLVMLVAAMAERSGHAAETISPDTGLVLYEDRQLRIIQVTPPDKVLLSGDIDVTNSPALATALADVAARWGQVTVDTEGLRFIDVSGWRILVGPHPRGGSRPRLLNIAPCVRRLNQHMHTL